jgi:hypothetical protein
MYWISWLLLKITCFVDEKYESKGYKHGKMVFVELWLLVRLINWDVLVSSPDCWIRVKECPVRWLICPNKWWKKPCLFWVHCMLGMQMLGRDPFLFFTFSMPGLGKLSISKYSVQLSISRQLYVEIFFVIHQFFVPSPFTVHLFSKLL